jgi:TRAP-type C4-dicarboxylate transport system substrate-binding protein
MKHGLAILVFSAAACAALQAQAQTVWKLATGYRAESFHTQNLQQFAKDVSAATDGRLIIEIHPNNSLAKLADIRAKVEAGEIAAGEVIMTSLVKQIPAAGADSVPFIVSSFDDARRLWDVQRPVIDPALAQRGLIGLYAVPWPSQGLFSTKPVRSSSDLKGAKMRTYNAATVRIAELTGATPVDVTMTDVAAAVAAGRIDSMITSGITGVENKVWGQIKYFYDIRAWFPKNLVMVNAAAFKALDAKTQAAVRQAAAVAEKRGWAMSEAAAATSMSDMTSHGMKIDPIGFEFRNELRRFGEKFSIEWVRSTGKDASAILIPYYTGAR